MYESERNLKKIRTYSSSGSSKVIDLGVNRKPMYDFLLVISNFGRISNRFRDIDAFSSRIAFFQTLPCLTPPSGGTPWDINIIYIPLKSTFNVLQFRSWHYRPIFIRLAAVASQSREIRQNSEKFDITAVQGHPRSSILVSIESSHATFY